MYLYIVTIAKQLISNHSRVCFTLGLGSVGESNAHPVTEYNSEEIKDKSSCETEDEMREKCNRLLQSVKKMTKLYVFSLMIHVTVLIFE